MDTPDTPACGRPNTAQIVVGAIVLGMGLVLLANRYFGMDVQLMRSWWPLLLIAMGSVRLTTSGASRDGRRCRRSGVWLIMVGVWGAVSDWHLLGFTFATSWPLLVMGAGVMMVWRAFETDAGSPVRREP